MSIISLYSRGKIVRTKVRRIGYVDEFLDEFADPLVHFRDRAKWLTNEARQEVVTVTLPMDEHFPQHWRDNYVTALLRTIIPPPFKRIKDRHERSWLSMEYTDVLVGRNAITVLLNNVGGSR